MIAARTALPVLAGAALLAAAPAFSSAPSQIVGVGERVAMALHDALEAERANDTAALAVALRVIDRSGARPLEGWNGTDPVPGWRSRVPAGNTPPLRGSSLGPGYRAGQIRAGQSDSFQLVFLSGRKASVALSSGGGAPLSLRVVDADHHAVCVADAPRGACRWVPLFTQRYLIEVRNGGQNRADYFLVVD